MELEVDRADLRRVRHHRSAPAPLDQGEVRLRVDHFALTTNNVTYAVFGDALSYWDFFPGAPATDAEPGQWGRVPVWGYATVVESALASIDTGGQVYGYLPMARELVVLPGRIDDRGFTDLSEHRRPMAPAYSRYSWTAADPAQRPGREALHSILYPLFYTGFVIDDFLADNGDFGADQVVLSSASSKTAIASAFLLHDRGVTVVGLTSPRNEAFVRALGCYDTVVPYTEAGAIDERPSVYVDVAGAAEVRAAVHHRLADRLGHSMAVGSTHWEAPPVDPGPLPGPAPAFLFAPTQIKKRTDELGAPALERRTVAAWDRYADWARSWLTIEHHRDATAVEAAYRTLLEGRADPATGHSCTLQPPADDSTNTKEPQ